MSATGAAMARGASKQDYGTPRDFLAAVAARFGARAWDLAATPENAKAPAYLTEKDDSLTCDWSRFRGNLWLNPPFANIAPWAAKCASTDLGGYARRILFLVPASVGANWFAAHVHRKALVLALQGRLTFEGCDQPYPKDCVLCVYGMGVTGFDVWDWRKEIAK